MPLCRRGDGESKPTHKHTQWPAPSPTAPHRTHHVSYHKGSSTGPNKWQTSSSTLCVPTHGSAQFKEKRSSAVGHFWIWACLFPEEHPAGWAIKQRLIGLFVQSCTSGPLCQHRVSVALWPLELKRQLMPGMRLNYTWILGATPELGKECDGKLWLNCGGWFAGLDGKQRKILIATMACLPTGNTGCFPMLLTRCLILERKTEEAV